MRSPDPDYEEKRQYAAERLEEARTDPDVTLLYLDECGYEKVPGPHPQPKATRRRERSSRPLPHRRAPTSRCALRPA